MLPFCYPVQLKVLASILHTWNPQIWRVTFPFIDLPACSSLIPGSSFSLHKINSIFCGCTQSWNSLPVVVNGTSSMIRFRKHAWKPYLSGPIAIMIFCFMSCCSALNFIVDEFLLLGNIAR